MEERTDKTTKRADARARVALWKAALGEGPGEAHAEEVDDRAHAEGGEDRPEAHGSRDFDPGHAGSPAEERAGGDADEIAKDAADAEGDLLLLLPPDEGHGVVGGDAQIRREVEGGGEAHDDHADKEERHPGDDARLGQEAEQRVDGFMSLEEGDVPGLAEPEAVGAVGLGPFLVEATAHEGVSLDELRGVATGHRGELQLRRKALGTTGVVAVTQVLLEECIDRVEDAAERTALETHGAVGVHRDVDAVDAWCVVAQLRRTGGGADAQFGTFLRLVVGDDGEVVAAAVVEAVRQRGGGEFFLGTGVHGLDNAIAGRAVGVQQRDDFLALGLDGLQRVAPFQCIERDKTEK